MPVEILDSVEATAHLDPLEIGALLGLCRAFWAGGARPLPTDDVDLMRLSGCDLRRWRLVRDTVLSAFEALKPPLASVYAESERILQAKRSGSQKGASVTNAKRRAATFAKPVELSDSASDAVGPLIPAKEKSVGATVFTINGDVIPKRVVRSSSAAKLTERA